MRWCLRTCLRVAALCAVAGTARGDAGARPRRSKQLLRPQSRGAFRLPAAAAAARPTPLAAARGAAGAPRGGGAARGGVLDTLLPHRWSPRQRAQAAALVALALQNSLLTLTMRYSRTAPHAGPRYLASEAVVMSELIKALISFLLAVAAATDFEAGSTRLRHAALQAFGDRNSDVLIVPATLYAVQNNLQYVAASNLEPAIFQLLYQMKLLTTALFSVLLLGRRLKALQWAAIALLAGGLAGVGAAQGQSASGNDLAHASFAVGFAAVSAACCTSGFSSVYFEKVVKRRRKPGQRPKSVWACNAQLATFSCIIAAIGAWVKDGALIRDRGFLAGFTPLVWVVVFLQAGGGLCTAAVIAYADNLLKGFATGVSMLLSVAASCVWFDFEITKPFVMGAVSVCGAILLYSQA
ncbi:nucleotide-sugar transporter-domain-containing protein [Pelagophyceae sp. CCMP2097]|nr:nucleotide-sugar transporter-domain-containing protein [Pelagophyceae sp. CCMP2097]